ncbi:hypothetical protein Ancab_038737 [Ancistrocladus abbreviatus]
MTSTTSPFSSMLSNDPQSLSISYMISYLKSSFLEKDFDEVERILTLREEKLRREKDEIQSNMEEFISSVKDEEKWMRERVMSVEEERYYKLLVDENGRLKMQMEECKKLFDELQKRVSELEEGLKSWMIKDIPLHSEDGGRAKRNRSLQDSGRQSVDVAHTNEQKEDSDYSMKFPEPFRRKLDFASEYSSMKRKSHVNKLVPNDAIDISDSGDDDGMPIANACKRKRASSESLNVRKSVHDDDDDDSESSCESQPVNDLIAKCWRSRMTKVWEFEADLLYAFENDDELCLKAVCALYRRHTKLNGGPFFGYRGFCRSVPRGIALGKFLVDGDPNGKMKKSVAELKQYDPNGLDDCRFLAKEHSKQLFVMYERNEDPLFP